MDVDDPFFRTAIPCRCHPNVTVHFGIVDLVNVEHGVQDVGGI